MLVKFFQWIKLHPTLATIASLSLGFFLVNLAAYKHARAMLHFSSHGQRTGPPESLSWLQKVKVLLAGVNVPKPLNGSTPADWGLSFAVHRFKGNAELILEAWYIPHPRPQGIVLMFHGYAVSKAQLLPEAHAFNELGYAAFMVDFRGSGGSSGNETSIGFYEAEDVMKAVEYLRSISDGAPLILYGQSMGSAAILRALYAYRLRPDAIILEAVFDKMLSTVQNRFLTIGVPSFPGAQLLIFWGSAPNGYSGFKHNPVEYATRVHCPTLMLHGTADSRTTIHQAKTVFRNLTGAKQFEAFAGVGHESYLAADPEKWKRTVSRFLAQLQGQRTD